MVNIFICVNNSFVVVNEFDPEPGYDTLLENAICIFK